jgi:O-acetyl-ADP-ribose deacetylase (regulator of RNase III)
LDFGGRKRNLRYDALAQVFEKLNSADLEELHIPKIGAGLAGGNWDLIETIINDVYKGDVICWVPQEVQE